MATLEILLAAALGAAPVALAPADTVAPGIPSAAEAESVCRVHSPGHLALDEVGAALCDLRPDGLLVEYYPDCPSSIGVGLAVVGYDGPGEYEASVVVERDGIAAAGVGWVDLRVPLESGELLSGTFVAPVFENGRIDTVEGSFVCRILE